MVFSENDLYVVRSDSLFGDTDQKVLTYLYQPLIGVEGVGIYNTLWNDLDHYKLQGDLRELRKLTKILRVSMGNLEECIKKIEAVGLLRTYLKNNYGKQCFVFEVNPPLSPDSFMKDEILSSFIKGEFNESELEEIMGLFKKKKINKSNFKEITHSFNSVFGSFNPEEITKRENELLGELKNGGPKVKSAFDMDMFLHKIKNSELALPERYITEELLETVEKLFFVYKYDANSMVRMVSDSLMDEGVDLNRLREFARESYLIKKNPKGPKMIDKSKVKLDNNETMSKLEKEIVNETPYQRLKSYFNGGQPPLVDLKVLDEVLIDIKLSAGVLNVLVDYVMFSNDRKFSKNYVLKIAAEWKRSGIETVKQAIDHARDEYKKRIEYQMKKEEQSKREKGEDKPDWVEEESYSGELTEEELAKQEEEIQRMLNE